MPIQDDFSLKRFLGFTCSIIVGLSIAYNAGYFSLYKLNSIERYGFFLAISIYLFKMIAMIGTLPNTLYVIGSTFFKDAKQNKAKSIPQKSKKTICFRVVTRGMFPKLIIKNRDYNLSVLKEFEKLKYTYEVVTDKKIGVIDTMKRCYEVVVPDEYSTKTEAKYKARALQYAVERNLSNLEDDDLVVHLDEESRLTKSCVIGIINFANQNKHQIGQGE